MKYINSIKFALNKVLDRTIGVFEMAILGIIVVSTLSYALAWSPPSQTPPTGNVDAPLNAGSTGQAKSGGLILNTGGAPTGLIVQNGNVGIGTANPTQKLDVAGGINVSGPVKVSDSEASCNAANSGMIKFTGTDFLGCVAGAWKSLVGAAPTVVKNLVYSQHTEDNCTGLSGSVTSDGTNTFCKFTKNACPSGWTQYKNWSTTKNKYGRYETSVIYTDPPSYTYSPGCVDSPDYWYSNYNSPWCIEVPSSCNTGSHTFSNNSLENCSFGYSVGTFITECNISSCTAATTEIGCY